MGLDKSGNIQYRSHTSRCQKCENFIRDPYICKWHKMIPYRIWENYIGFDCNEFKSTILKDQLNNHYIFPDYEDRDRFPEKKFGQGKYRFDKNGNKI